jgi:hypothetical protein
MNGGMNSYVGFVRAVVAGAGSMNSRVRFEADSLASARYLLYRIYGRENVLGVQEVLIEDSAVIKPLSPEQLQVKSLTDNSAQLKQQAKKTKSLQKLQKAQQDYAKVSSSSVQSSMN